MRRYLDAVAQVGLARAVRFPAATALLTELPLERVRPSAVPALPPG